MSVMEEILTLIKRADKQARVETAHKVEEEKRSQFDNYGGNEWDSELFPAIKESTVRRKKGNDKPLLRTGRLRKAIHVDEEDFFDVEVDDVIDERGRPYKDRAEDFITKHGGKHSFSKVSKKEADKAVDYYVDALVEGLRSGGG